jgi:hypothetical protein
LPSNNNKTHTHRKQGAKKHQNFREVTQQKNTQVEQKKIVCEKQGKVLRKCVQLQLLNKSTTIFKHHLGLPSAMMPHHSYKIKEPAKVNVR